MGFYLLSHAVPIIIYAFDGYWLGVIETIFDLVGIPGRGNPIGPAGITLFLLMVLVLVSGFIVLKQLQKGLPKWCSRVLYSEYLLFCTLYLVYIF